MTSAEMPPAVVPAADRAGPAASLDDPAIAPGGVLGGRPVILAGIGQTIEVTARGVRLPPGPPIPGAPLG